MERRHLSASQAWNAAREAGIEISLVGTQLELKARRKPSETVLRALKAVREELISLLRHEPGKLCGIDYIDHFEERAAYGEYEAGMTRQAAELHAYEYCVSLWLSQNTPALPDHCRCVHCGADKRDDNLALALQADGENAWVHTNCHRPFLAQRRQKAMAALAGFGILFSGNSARDFGKKAG